MTRGDGADVRDRDDVRPVPVEKRGGIASIYQKGAKRED